MWLGANLMHIYHPERRQAGVVRGRQAEGREAGRQKERADRQEAAVNVFMAKLSQVLNQKDS
jgi:hypothetical protein